MLAQGKVSQRAAQAAAWHLNNHLSWDELRAKRLKVAFGLTRPYFTKRELAEGEEAADEAVRVARAATKKRKSPSLSMH
jgi:hypothetical protein